MSTTRIYVVIGQTDNRLVEATSAAQAIRHCVRNKYAAKPATPKEIALHMGAGKTVEQATETTTSATAHTKGE